MIEKIFSLIIIFVVTLLLGMFLFITIFNHQAETQQAARLSYEQEYGELFVSSLFLSHDNATELTYDALLALSLKQISTNIIVNDRAVNITERFMVPLDALLGKNNYYFTVAPLRKGVAVSYILDGSTTMDDKRAAVRDGLPLLIGNLTVLFGENAVIYTNVYILSSDPAKCSGFQTTERQHCRVLSAEDLYPALMSHGDLGPYPVPFHSFFEWQQSTHAALPSYFSDSDWASAAAYASYQYQEDRQRRLLTNKHVIVAVADEMTTGSKADECFTLKDGHENIFCNLCNSTCPVDRSERVTNATRKTLMRNGDLFIGFYQIGCDYHYDTALNNLYLAPYACKYLDNKDVCSDLPSESCSPQTVACAPAGKSPYSINPGAEVNWCTQQACGGCVPSTTNGLYCFHTNCGPYIITSMQNLSESTGGMALPLADLNDLTTVVSDYFSKQLQEFNLTLGLRNETRNRFVVEQPFSLADGTQLNVSFWMYD